MTTLVRLALAAAAIPLGVVAYRVQVRDFHSPHERAAAIVAVAYAFLVAGLAAWARRPGNRLGPLMAGAAFALLARQLRYSEDPLVFTAFFALGDLGYALVGHAALAYPSGRVVGRAERALVQAAYATVLLFPLGTLLVYDGSRPLLFFGAIGRDSAINIAANAGVAGVPPEGRGGRAVRRPGLALHRCDRAQARARDSESAPDALAGRPGTTSCTATAREDVICGLGGNDTLTAVGDDTLDGGRGDDLLIASRGGTTVAGVDGNDRLIGSSGDDTLSGGNGNDRLLGGDGKDDLDGRRGRDVLLARDGVVDRVDGGFGPYRARADRDDWVRDVESISR